MTTSAVATGRRVPVGAGAEGTGPAGTDGAGAAADLLRSAAGGGGPALARLLTEAVEDGRLPPGARLPTIGEVADLTGLGRSTVAGVWSLLVDRGVVETRRRGGTRVLGTVAATQGPWPTAGPSAAFSGWASVDLATAHPAPDQLPDLLEAFTRSLREPRTNSLQREAITPALRAAVAERWPFEAQEWVTVSGAGEATLLTAEAATPPGGKVAVQQPAVAGTVGNLRAVGLELVGVDSDAEGPLPASFERALRSGARTFVHQPGGEFARLGATSPARLQTLAEVVSTVAPDTWVVEEDVLGPLAPATAPPTLGVLLPGRVVRVTSFCRAYGLDLRTTVVGGAAEVVSGVRRLRSHGILAQSRILQNALAHLLEHERVGERVRLSAERYAHRARTLAALLEVQGAVTAVPPGGLVVWVRVENEDEALAELAGHGVVLPPSSRTSVTTAGASWVRVATPQLPDDEHLLRELAGLVAGAATRALLAG